LSRISAPAACQVALDVHGVSYAGLIPAPATLEQNR
jgi:hypothetical protein